MGKQDKKEGQFMIYIAARFGMRRMLCERVLVVEEPNRFDPKIYGDGSGTSTTSRHGLWIHPTSGGVGDDRGCRQ